MTMRFPRKLLFLTLVIATAEVVGAYAQEGSAPKGQWGPEVRGAKLSLAAPTFMRVGQPFEVRLATSRVGHPWPPLSIPQGGHGSLKLELTDAQGRTVPFRRQDLGSSGDIAHLSLWPTESKVLGRYWETGEYVLRASIEIDRNLMQPEMWHGKLVSNVLHIRIAPPNAPVPSPLDDAEFRKRVSDLISDLESPQFKKRQAAEKTLKQIGVPAMPFLDAAIVNASPERSKRIQAAMKDILSSHSLFDRNVWDGPYPTFGSYLASLDDFTWESLRKNLGKLRAR